MRNFLYKITVLLTTIVTTLFLLKFKINTHCTQYVSFWLSLSGDKAHPEESFHFPNLPIVYNDKFGILIRIYLAFIILCFLYIPIISSVLYKKEICNKSIVKTTNIIVISLFLFNLILPWDIVGERFDYFYGIVFFYGLFQYSIFYFLHKKEILNSKK